MKLWEKCGDIPPLPPPNPPSPVGSRAGGGHGKVVLERGGHGGGVYVLRWRKEGGGKGGRFGVQASWKYDTYTGECQTL